MNHHEEREEHEGKEYMSSKSPFVLFVVKKKLEPVVALNAANAP